MTNHHFFEHHHGNDADRADVRGSLYRNYPRQRPQQALPLLRGESPNPKTKTGHSPRQRKNGPDHKLSVLEAAMAKEANTRVPRERQGARYARAVPIGDVVHNILADLSRKVGK